MARMSDVVRQAGQQLGLDVQPGQTNLFGDLDGFLVQLLSVKDDNRVESIVAMIRHGQPEGADAVKEAISSADLAAIGIKSKDVTVDEDLVTIKISRGFVRRPDAEAVVQAFESVLDIVKSQVEPGEPICNGCEEAFGGPPILINGVVHRMCPSCVEDLHQAADEARAAYDALPLNLPLTIATAAILAVVGAAIWAGIAVGLSGMFWMVAIGIGALIGFGTSKAAGKGAVIVQVIGGAFTVISMLLGEVVTYGYYAQKAAAQEGFEIDWLMFLQATPEILMETPGDTAFALGGGLIGAFYAAKMGAKPNLAVDVEG